MAGIVETIKLGARILSEAGVDNPDYDSFALFSDITGITRTDYLVRKERQVEPEDYDKFMEFIARRSKREPLQHILGKAWFFGRKFAVNSDVLVPRPDTEVLVEKALAYLSGGECVLDMCTGSGCIITTLALERNLSKAIGVDLSEAALKVAQTNVESLGAEVELIRSDLFTELGGAGFEEKFHMIVSNPPYIETSVIDTLSDEVRLFDPIMALDGREDGLYFYRSITQEASKYLKSGGVLIYEIGYNQAEAVCDIMKEQGFVDIEVMKDYGGLDRVVIGKSYKTGE